MTNDSYDEGRRDGRLDAIEQMQAQQNNRLDDHSDRIRAQERVVYGLIGAIALIEIIPAVKSLI